MDEGAQAVRDFFGAWAAGDLQAMLALVSDDVVAEPGLEPIFERRAYHGRDGISAAFRELAGRWERFEPLVEDARQAGDRVVAFLRLVFHARGTSPDAHIAVVCTVRDGTITSLVGHDAGALRDHLG
jgi:ketosteroid isomerase-like protein